MFVMFCHVGFVLQFLYRLSSTEMRTLAQYIWTNQDGSAGQTGQRLLEMVEHMSQSVALTNECVSFSPFMDFQMSRLGYACIRTPLGDRSWPPAAGYSFACWARFENVSSQTATKSSSSAGGSESANNSKGLLRTRSCAAGSVLRIFTVGTTEEKISVCAELFLDDTGVLSLATSPTSYICFKGVRIEQGIWYHLAIVHNKPNALAGLFQSSIASLYVNGSLRQTGKLGYSLPPVGKSLQVITQTIVSILNFRTN